MHTIIKNVNRARISKMIWIICGISKAIPLTFHFVANVKLAGVFSRVHSQSRTERGLQAR